jgi:hypothetical protein
MAYRGGLAWHFFVQGQRALGDLDDPTGGGLHLYAALPVLQIGPVPLLAALVVSPLGPQGSLLLAQVFGGLAGAVILWLARRIARETRRDLTAEQIDSRVALATVFFTPVWMYLAVGQVHLDDVLTLLFAVLALHLVLRQRAVAAGVLLGLAVDCKPWALPFGCLLLLLVDRRARVVGAAAMGAVIAAAWSPFFLVDPATTNAMHFTISNTGLSALRVIGVDAARTPSWDRPAQVALGLTLGVLALRRGRWAAVILMAVAARVVLDPGTNLYYTAGLVVGAALWDIIRSPAAQPWWTAAVGLGLFASRWIPMPPSAHGWLTLGFFLACCALALAGAKPGRRPVPGVGLVLLQGREQPVAPDPDRPGSSPGARRVVEGEAEVAVGGAAHRLGSVGMDGEI